MTFLGDAKERPGREGFSGKSDGPLRSVRAKREADEAGKPISQLGVPVCNS